MVFIYSSNYFASDRKKNNFCKCTRVRDMANLLLGTIPIGKRTPLPSCSPRLTAVSNTAFVNSDYSALFLDCVLEEDTKIKSAAPFKADKPPTRFPNR